MKMTTNLLNELTEAVRIRFLNGLMVEESIEELQDTLSKTVYHMYQQFSRNSSQTQEEMLKSEPTSDKKDIPDPVSMSKKDQSVQTNPVELISEMEQDMLHLIREHNINMTGIASLAKGMAYNYSNNRYTVETEDILLDSEDETAELDANEGLKAGMEFSQLNKLIMSLINDNLSSNVLVLLKILKIIIQDHNIIYKDIIMDIINRECQQAEANMKIVQTKVIEKPVTDRPCKEKEINIPYMEVKILKSIGINTDLSGDVVTSLSHKRKTTRSRPDKTPNWLNDSAKEAWLSSGVIQPSQQQIQAPPVPLKAVPEPEQVQTQPFDQNQYNQQAFPQPKPMPNIHIAPPTQDTLCARKPMNQSQPVNQVKNTHHYHNNYQYQQPLPMHQEDHNQYSKNTQRVNENPQRPIGYPAQDYTMPQLKRSQKVQTSNQAFAKQFASKMQCSPATANVHNNSPQFPMYSMVPPQNEYFQRRGENSPHHRQMDQAYNNPHLDSLQSMQEYPNRMPPKNAAMPANQYQMPATDHQFHGPTSANPMLPRQPAVAVNNNLQNMSMYGSGPYPIVNPTMETPIANQQNVRCPSRMPQNQAQQPAANYSTAFRGDRHAMLNNDAMFNRNMTYRNQMGQSNQFYGNNNMPMQSRLPTNTGWDMPKNSCSKNGMDNFSMYDTCGRY